MRVRNLVLVFLFLPIFTFQSCSNDDYDEEVLPVTYPESDVKLPEAKTLGLSKITRVSVKKDSGIAELRGDTLHFVSFVKAETSESPLKIDVVLDGENEKGEGFCGMLPRITLTVDEKGLAQLLDTENEKLSIIRARETKMKPVEVGEMLKKVDLGLPLMSLKDIKSGEKNIAYISDSDGKNEYYEKILIGRNEDDVFVIGVNALESDLGTATLEVTGRLEGAEYDSTSSVLFSFTEDGELALLHVGKKASLNKITLSLSEEVGKEGELIATGEGDIFDDVECYTGLRTLETLEIVPLEEQDLGATSEMMEAVTVEDLSIEAKKTTMIEKEAPLKNTLKLKLTGEDEEEDVRNAFIHVSVDSGRHFLHITKIEPVSRKVVAEKTGSLGLNGKILSASGEIRFREKVVSSGESVTIEKFTGLDEIASIEVGGKQVVAKKDGESFTLTSKRSGLATVKLIGKVGRFHYSNNEKIFALLNIRVERTGEMIIDSVEPVSAFKGCEVMLNEFFLQYNSLEVIKNAEGVEVVRGKQKNVSSGIFPLAIAPYTSIITFDGREVSDAATETSSRPEPEPWTLLLEVLDSDSEMLDCIEDRTAFEYMPCASEYSNDYAIFIFRSPEKEKKLEFSLLRSLEKENEEGVYFWDEEGKMTFNLSVDEMGSCVLEEKKE